MSPLSQFVRLRPEVAALDWERIRGHILFKDLITPLDSLEKDARWLFSRTFPTTLLQAILQEIKANLLRSSRGRYSPLPADKRGAEIAHRGKYRYDLDIVDHVYHLVKSGKAYPRHNVPELPPDRGWNDLLQRGQSLASALFMRTGDETYKKVRRTLERLGRDVGEEVALKRRLL